MTVHDDPEDDWRAALSKPIHVESFQPASSEVQLEIAAASECGTVQAHNTDNYLVIRLGRLQETLLTSLASSDLPPRFEEYAYAMLVADGFGEHGAGARASRIALSVLAHTVIRYGQWHVRIDPGTHADVVEQGELFYRRTSDALREASLSDSRLADMASSLTATYVTGTDLFFAHVGHSKAFLFRDGVLLQLTTDHTLEDAGPGSHKLVTLERPRVDLRHIVTETLGGRPGGPNIEIEHFQLWAADRLLLCTNGLTDVVDEEQIADVLALQRQPDDDCRRLVGLALAAGAPDNVTVISAHYTRRPSRQPTELSELLGP